MELYSFDEMLNEEFGPIGTPDRDAFEKEVSDSVEAYKSVTENTQYHFANVSKMIKL